MRFRASGARQPRLTAPPEPAADALLKVPGPMSVIVRERRCAHHVDPNVRKLRCATAQPLLDFTLTVSAPDSALQHRDEALPAVRAPRGPLGIHPAYLVADAGPRNELVKRTSQAATSVHAAPPRCRLRRFDDRPRSHGKARHHFPHSWMPVKRSCGCLMCVEKTRALPTWLTVNLKK